METSNNNNQYYLIGYDTDKLITIKDLLFKERNIKCNIVYTLPNFDKVIKNRRNDNNIQIIYVDFRLNNNLYEFYNQLRNNSFTIENTLDIITMEVDGHDKANFIIKYDSNNTLTDIAHKIWKCIRKCEED